MPIHTPKRGFSFEFFPPKTEAGRRRFGKVVQRLAQLAPSFVSVTFGAGGSTREGSYQTASEIVRTTDLDVTPHLSCIGSTVEQIAAQLDTYRAIGVDRVVALRGDVPEDEPDLPRAFAYANELVEFIKASGGFHISVACYPEYHPEASDPSADVDNFVRKVRAGADEAITQYFYTNDAYYRFLDQVHAQGIDLPVVPGLMPMTDYQQAQRFSRFCGADIPRWMRLRMEALAEDSDGQKELGIELATRQAEDLLRQGAPGIHFYTLNRAEPTLRIWDNLGLPRVAAPAPARPRQRDLRPS
ncbi:MAG: methylenetetrahydrofolate reductase [NAD(P)H] [Myxococcales bacterium]|nr:methylenetetrahydrofolate reductase [NAD(P)H] [Myxococcales bacterium]MDD9966054.1 methylenetetrahydrofolate reductase [NAD(P)H] [Myxococcales bacterium]